MVKSHDLPGRPSMARPRRWIGSAAGGDEILQVAQDRLAAAQVEPQPATDRELNLALLVAEAHPGDDREPAAGAAQHQLVGAGVCGVLRLPASWRADNQ